MNPLLRRFGCFFVCAVAFTDLSFAQSTSEITLVDVHGFESNSIYPAGNLGSVTDNNAVWHPASSPAQIVLVGGTNKVFRRRQTGVDNTDTVSFPPVSNGVLTLEFDARASDSATRTLDVVLLPESGAQMASMLGWATVTNKFCFYDGTNWIPLVDLDTNWHHFEMVNDIESNKFDLKFDGALIGQNLKWRNSFSAGSSFSRLRLGAIRGVTNTYADVDNLVITAIVPEIPPTDEGFALTNLNVSNGKFSFDWLSESNREYLLESNDDLSPKQWRARETFSSEASWMHYTNSGATNPAEFFRMARLLPLESNRNDGFRGIWFTLGQFSEYGDKYSGGLGTYTANHVPIAIYSPEVNKTFFVYGGTIKNDRHLLIMASCYDHATHQVIRPTIVRDKNGVNDPHDNASICIDDKGYIWVFVSGRATARPGFKYRSTKPYSTLEFQLVRQDEMTYPQPWFIPGFGFFHLFTKYTNGRELYWETSTNGVDWSPHHKLAGIGGHYQVSCVRDGKIASFFNRHPGGNVDKRTDLYYVQTTDFGTNWTTVDGTPLTMPLTTTNNPALVVNLAAQGKLMYGMDLNFDTNGNPVMLYIVSNDYKPGPSGDPRVWTVTRWDGAQWLTSAVTTSDHNYDTGSLYIRPDRWLIIGPTQNGPQLYQAGGEMALWQSVDEGATWTMLRQITTNSVYNHTYARRSLNATDPFSVFWADGDPTMVTPSHLYFGNLDGTHVWQLPYDTSAIFNTPQEVLATP